MSAVKKDESRFMNCKNENKNIIFAREYLIFRI